MARHALVPPSCRPFCLVCVESCGRRRGCIVFVWSRRFVLEPVSTAVFSRDRKPEPSTLTLWVRSTLGQRSPAFVSGLSYPRSAYTTLDSPSLSNALALSTRWVSLERLPRLHATLIGRRKLCSRPRGVLSAGIVVASQAINSVELDDELACKARDRTVGWFSYPFRWQNPLFWKGSSATPSRHRQEDDGDDEVSTATLISSSWRLCFTSGIILSEGRFLIE